MTRKRLARKSTTRTRRQARPDPLIFPEGFHSRLQQAIPKLDLVNAFLQKPEVRALGGAYAGASLCVLDVRLVISQFFALSDQVAAQEKARGAR
jgi:hypothetical protein